MHGSANTSDNFTPSSYAPAKRGPRKNDATYSTIIPVNTRRLAATARYKRIDFKKGKLGRTDLMNLRRLIDTVGRYEKAVKERDSERRKRQEKELRQVVQHMEHFPSLSDVLIKKSQVLDDRGLPAIFDNADGIEFPYDIRADALYLYNRWITGDIDGHLLRGIKTEKQVLESGKRRAAHRLEPGYEKKSSNYVGTGSLVNGQWWPSRLCLMRDGAHGEVEAGIAGQTGKGAYSVVVSGGGYADDDQGEDRDRKDPLFLAVLMLNRSSNIVAPRATRHADERHQPHAGGGSQAEPHSCFPIGKEGFPLCSPQGH